MRPPGAAPETTPTLADLMTIALARRVDLRALQGAWQGNEAMLRGALLARFPRVEVGVNGGEDPGRYAYGGANVAISIPIFDGGRGTRAIAVATREQLKAELEARVFDIRRVLGDALAVIEFARRERTLLQLLVPDLTSSEAALAAARDRGDATAAAWAEARSQLLDTRLRLLEVGASEREAFIALEAATGTAALRTTP